MDKLVALPVKGESFLLRRRSQNILVDGGYSSQGLASALSGPDVGVSHLNIVVCTHADRDHAGGLTDLLEGGAITADEFWLPGAWSDALPELLRHPDRVVDALVAEFEAFELDEERRSVDRDLEREDADDSFEARVHSRIAKQRLATQRDRVVERAGPDGKKDRAVLNLQWLNEQAANTVFDPAHDSAIAKVFARGRRRIRYRGSKKSLDRRWTAFWVNLIDTGERIRKIAVQAIRHQVPVRWFDFNEFAKTRRSSGGEPDLLVPLNSIELLVPPPPNHMMKYMARLTPTNEECLVFLSPGANWPFDLGVVFTGDSPLGDPMDYSQALLDWPTGMADWVVATAPHHGSESNAMAYDHLQQCSTVSLWLRAGGSAKHPGPTFRALKPHERGCTHCPHSKLEREVAEVQLNCPTIPFLFRVRAHDCNC
ncbi:MBL fold metallo-hydrolase [Variovorax paradoxus]|uniref:MBL fold metallo-hydrolase n=1 Tax=Variovorax paradoxus TaxID=34073 RepID=UPI002783E940|nr:MBL fold metallo-hydrolase [Variovorax paradoxus]MDP9933497.1 hypothetical protein [Variovorax paradoxus]